MQDRIARADGPRGDRRVGYRRPFVLLRREGEPSGINRIYRLYREEGLTVRKRKARRKAIGTRAPLLVEARPNAAGWSLDSGMITPFCPILFVLVRFTGLIEPALAHHACGWRIWR